MRAVLWDMDGTLIDSEPLWAQACFEMSAAMGRRLSEERQRDLHGVTWQDTLRICADWAGIELNKRAWHHYHRWLFDRMHVLLATVRLEEDIAATLNSLKATGIPSFIVTNTARELAGPAIAAMGAELFAGSLCGDEVARGKPDPEMYRTAARSLGFEPHECLAVEDSFAGMQSAVSAGCVVVAAPGATTTRPQGVRPHTLVSYAGIDATTLLNMYRT